MLPVEFKAILYGGSVKIRSIELFGSRDRRLRADSLNSLYLFVFVKSVYLIATRDLSNLWLQFFLSQNQGFMRLFEKTVLK